MDRRNFFKSSASLAAFAALTLSGISCGDSSTNSEDTSVPNGVSKDGNLVKIDLAVQIGLKSGGGYLVIKNSDYKLIVINVDGVVIKAFTSICTHEGCDVSSFSSGKMSCPCHGSKFSTDGSVAAGPATRKLTEYSVSRTGDILTITKS